MHWLFWLAQLVWVPVAFVVVSTFWLLVTIPAGAQTQMADGHCYRMEIRRIIGLTMGYLYWEVSCP